jgi:hypothetical protein
MKQKGNVMMDEAELLARLRLETFCANMRADAGERLYWLVDLRRACGDVIRRVTAGIIEYDSWSN